MNGLFEIHVSVCPIDILKFRLWALDNDVKAISIIGGFEELTFSKYTNGTHEKAYGKAISMARNLSLNSIKVTKVRIEAIFSNKDAEIDAHAKSNPNTYFEYHVKYHVINSKDFYELNDIAVKFTDDHLDEGVYSVVGFNSFKKNVEPIISLRVPSKFGIDGSLEFKDKLIKVLKAKNFRTNEEIHKEYVFVDDDFSKL